MKNIALISDITAVHLTSPSTTFPIDFISGSAEIEIDESSSQQGYFQRIQLSFLSSGFTAIATADMVNLKRADYIEATDVCGATYRLGTPLCRPKFSISIQSGKTPGSFRGRRITVESSQL